MTHGFTTGDVIHGFAAGSFGRDSYACRRVEAVGADWVLTRSGTFRTVEMVSSDRIPTWEQANNLDYCHPDCEGPRAAALASLASSPLTMAVAEASIYGKALAVISELLDQYRGAKALREGVGNAVLAARQQVDELSQRA